MSDPIGHTLPRLHTIRDAATGGMTRKTGPLPNWAWVAIVSMVLVVIATVSVLALRGPSRSEGEG